jgi:hypothetical protein
MPTPAMTALMKTTTASEILVTVREARRTTATS